MGNGRLVHYVRCRNCGRYAPGDTVHQSYYCSEECAVRYTACATCGRYFRRPAEGNVVYCSSECAAVYDIPIEKKISDLLMEAS